MECEKRRYPALTSDLWLLTHTHTHTNIHTAWVKGNVVCIKYIHERVQPKHDMAGSGQSRVETWKAEVKKACLCFQGPHKETERGCSLSGSLHCRGQDSSCGERRDKVTADQVRESFTRDLSEQSCKGLPNPGVQLLCGDQPE